MCQHAKLRGGEQFFEASDPIGQASSHRSDAGDSRMYPAEIAIGEVQGARRFEIVHALAVSIRQPGKSADCHPHPLRLVAVDQVNLDVPCLQQPLRDIAVIPVALTPIPQLRRGDIILLAES